MLVEPDLNRFASSGSCEGGLTIGTARGDAELEGRETAERRSGDRLRDRDELRDRDRRGDDSRLAGGFTTRR
jgi:hypothetical protein